MRYRKGGPACGPPSSNPPALRTRAAFACHNAATQTLRRFLRARKHDIYAAQAMFVDMLKVCFLGMASPIQTPVGVCPSLTCARFLGAGALIGPARHSRAAQR